MPINYFLLNKTFSSGNQESGERRIEVRSEEEDIYIYVFCI